MSAGIFSRSRYEANYGTGNNVHPIRVQPETEGASDGTLINDPPGGDIDIPISAIVSNGRRARGLTPRFVYMRLTGTPPTGYAPGSTAKLVCLTESFYNAVAAVGTEITYLATEWEVTGFQPERAI